MRYRYVAYNLQVGLVKGHLDAGATDEAQVVVSQQGYKLLQVAPALRPPGLDDLFPSLFHVGRGELVRFTRQLATMLESGGNLVRTLEMLQRETRNRMMRRTLEDVRSRLDNGASLSVALAAHPTVFGPLLISVVEVGEQTGKLGPALEQVADIMQKEQEARQKAIRTMMYPLAIVALSILTLFVLITVALPPLLRVFEQLDTDVPLVTRVALAMIGWLRENIVKLLLVALVVLALVILLRRIPKARYWLDSIQVRVPLMGPFIVMSELARFSRTISLLLGAGVTLSVALQQAIKSCHNGVIKRALSEADDSLMRGHTLAEALKRHPVLPTMFVELIVIGEESNSLPRTLGDAAQTYQRQVEQRLEGLLALLEPASTVIVGGIVGFIAFSMFVPIYSGMNALG